jgi:hypothetical protein
MSLAALTEKLTLAGAIETQEGILTFTVPFGSYLILSFGSNNVSKAATLEDWQKVLGYFHPLLNSLSADEITSIVLLLEFFLDNTGISVASGQ